MARNVTVGGSEASGSFDGLDPATFIPTADDAIVDADSIATRLSAGQSVGITTGTTGSQDGDISVAAAVAKTAGGNATLTLDAADDVAVNQSIASLVGALTLMIRSGNGVTNGPGDGIAINAALSSNGGDITLTGDRMALAAPIDAGSATVTLQPYSAGRLINLGSTLDSTADTLELSDAELDLITAGRLVIGNSTAGAITVSAALNPANAASLALVTASTVAVNANIVTKGDISIDNGGALTLAANLTTDGGNVTVAGSTTLGAGLRTINTIDVNTGASPSAGDITLGAITGNDLLALARGRDGAASSDDGAITLGAITLSTLFAAGRTVQIGAGSNVSSLAVLQTEAGAAFSYTDLDALNINLSASSLGISGVHTNNGAISLATVAGDLSIRLAVDAGTSTVALSAGGADQTLLIRSAVIGRAGVSLTADRFDLPIGSVDAGSATVTLQPYSAGRLIDLGSTLDSTADTLELSDAELDLITAGRLVIGNSTAGAITVSAALNPANAASLALVTASTVAVNANIVTKGDISIDNGGVLTLAANLTTDGGYVTVAGSTTLGGAGSRTINTIDINTGTSPSAGDITLGAITGNDLLALARGRDGNASSDDAAITLGAITLSTLIAAGRTIQIGAGSNVSSLAVLQTEAGAGFSYTDLDALNINLSVPSLGISGVHTNNGAISLATVAGDLSIRFAVDAGTSTVTLSAGGADQTLLIRSAVIGRAGVSLTADRIDLPVGSVDAGSATVTLQPYSAGRLINLGSTLDSTADTLELSDAELDRITAGRLVIGNSTAGDIVLTDAVTPAGSDTLILRTGGAISTVDAFSLPGLEPTITAASLGLLAGASVTLTATGNDVQTLAGAVSGAGGAFSYTDASALTVGTVDTIAGVTTNNGAITLTAGDTLTVSSPISAGSGAVTLGGHDIALNAAVTTSGLLTLNAPGTATLGVALNQIGSLATDAGGITAINGGAVTTAGAQHYRDSVTLGAVTTLASSGGGAITFDAAVTMSAGLTLQTSGNATFAGPVGGSGVLTLAGSGTTTLAATNTYAGETHVDHGTLIVDGSIAASLLTTVASGATIGGHGTVGALTVASGGKLNPGSGPATLSTGDLTLASGAILTIEIGGTGHDQLRVTGSVSLAGASLDGLLFGGFDPAAPGATFTIIDNDAGDAVEGTFKDLGEGALLDVAGHRLAISYRGGDGNDVVLSSVDDAPTIAIPPSGTIDVIEDTASALTGISFADVDAGDGSVTVTLAVGSGTLAAASSASVTVGGTPGALTLSGRIADINAFIAASGVTFATAANAASDVMLTVAIDDNGNSGPDPGLSGTASSEAATTSLTLQVTPVNDAPTVAVPPSGTIDVIEDTASALTGMSFADVDAADASVTVTLAVGSGTLAAASSTSVTVGGTPGALTLSGGIADINALLASSGVTFTTQANATSDVTLTVTIDDNGHTGVDPGLSGTASSEAATTSLTLHVTPVNDAPTIAVPPSGTIDVIEDTASALTGISFADVDAADASVTVTLAVGSGTLAAASAASVTFGGTPGALTLSGRIADINAFIAASGVTFATAANAASDVMLTVAIDDNGNSGPDPGLSGTASSEAATTSLTLQVTPVNDTPTVAVPPSGTIDVIEDTASALTGMSFADVDAADASVTVTLAVGSGTLAAASSTSVTVGGTPGALTLSGGIADINALLASSGVTFTTQANASSDVTLTVTIDDNGHTGVDPGLSGTASSEAAITSLTLHVTPVDDAPVIGAPVALAPVSQDSGARLITQSELLANAFDLDSSLQAVGLAIVSGAGTLIDNHAGTWSYTPVAGDSTAVTFSYSVTDGRTVVADMATLDILPLPQSPDPVIHGTSGIDSFDFGFRLVDATVSFLGNTVVIDGPSGRTILSGFEVFRFTDGTVDNADSDRMVDDLFYYARNHDVWNARVDADQHFHAFGWHEGRDPSAFFSTAFYLGSNPDVQVAAVDPLIHFNEIGWREGRVPSIAFDARQYLDANPDVAAAHVDPLAHYLQFGYQEDRTPFPATELLASNGFDYVYYLAHNPDVAAAGVDALQHFQSVGWKEGRDPNALFDVDGYLDVYADVKAAGVNPLDHYHAFGWKEGRDPSIGFDTSLYLDAYADVKAEHVDPLAHYLRFGRHEGRSPFADGDFG